ncbi:MAG: hypothetical protein ACRDTE_01980 [Pseudonocardiaceae bacterium]
MQASEQALPWPTPWPQMVRPGVVLWGVLGSVAVLAIAVGGVVGWMTGDSSGVVFLLATPILVVAAGGWLSVNVRGRNRRSSNITLAHVSRLDQSATVVPYSRGLYVAYLLWPAAVMIFFLPIFLVTLLDVLDGSVVRDAATVVILVLGGVAVVYALWFAFDLLSSRWSRGLVALSPEGVYHRSVVFRSYFPWEAVTEISAIDNNGPFIAMGVRDGADSWFERTSRLWRQEELAFAPHMAVRGRWLSVDPAIVYYALIYYRDHPVARRELDTTVGADRLRSGSFEV